MSKFKILHNFVRIKKTYYILFLWMCFIYKQNEIIFVHFSVFAHLSNIFNLIISKPSVAYFQHNGYNRRRLFLTLLMPHHMLFHGHLHNCTTGMCQNPDLPHFFHVNTFSCHHLPHTHLLHIH